MDSPIFSLIYTTVRPQLVWAVCHKWLIAANNLSVIELVVATDAGDSATAQSTKYAFQAFKLNKIYQGVRLAHVIQPDPDGDCAKGWNAAAAASIGRVIVQVSDDFTPPFNWDSLLLNLTCEHGGKWWEHDHAVHVNDAFVQSIMTSAIITKVRYQKFGYFYYPGYKSMFGDTELTEVAYRDKVVINASQLVFTHHHYNRQQRASDQVDEKHGSRERWNTGEALFNKRKAAGFPLDLTISQNNV